MTEFRNGTEYEFKDISSEVRRSYTFPNGENVTIEAPLKLHVSDSGGHRIFDAAGCSHYVPLGWIHIQWFAKDGQPHFVA